MVKRLDVSRSTTDELALRQRGKNERGLSGMLSVCFAGWRKETGRSVGLESGGTFGVRGKKAGGMLREQDYNARKHTMIAPDGRLPLLLEILWAKGLSASAAVAPDYN